MTSFLEITFLGGLPALEKAEAFEVVGAFLPQDLHPNLSIMATDGPATQTSAQRPQTFFDQLSTCRTTDHLSLMIRYHHAQARNPQNTQDPDASRYYSPTEYHITEIVVFKRRFVIQHEGFVFRVQHQPPPNGSPAEPDFLIAINRSIDLPRKSIFSSSTKLAIDRVNCSLVHPASPDPLQGTFRHPIVWRMPGPDPNYAFDLNLFQVGVLLQTIAEWNPNPEYHAIRKKCFWHSYIIRTVIRYIIQYQQLPVNNATVAAEEPHHWGATLGKCFGIRLDAADQGEAAAIMINYRKLLNRWHTASTAI